MALAEILDNRKELSPDECARLLDEGIRKEQFLQIAKAVASVSLLTRIAGISTRSLSRIKAQDTIPDHAAEVVLSLIRILLKGAEVFGGVEETGLWLNRPNRALRDVIPLEMLKSRFGAEEVMDVLVRLEHGVYS